MGGIAIRGGWEGGVGDMVALVAEGLCAKGAGSPTKPVIGLQALFCGSRSFLAIAGGASAGPVAVANASVRY